MLKKIALLFALLSTLSQYAVDLSPLIEIKPSYFFFSQSPLKNVYYHGAFQIQASASGALCDYLDLYGSIGYRKAQGNALNTGEKTSLTVVPFDIGLKPIFNFWDRFYSFFAIGPRFFYVHQRNYSPYVDRKISSGSVGLFVNSGFNVMFADCFSLGIFGEYSYEKKRISPCKANVYSNGSTQLGGFAFGASFGYVF